MGLVWHWFAKIVCEVSAHSAVPVPRLWLVRLQILAHGHFSLTYMEDILKPVIQGLKRFR